jgi:hypothetical protein
MNQDSQKPVNDSTPTDDEIFSGNEPPANQDGVGTPPQQKIPEDSPHTEDERTGEGTGARAGEYS